MNIKVVKDKKDAQVTFRIAKDGEDPVRIIKELKDTNLTHCYTQKRIREIVIDNLKRKGIDFKLNQYKLKLICDKFDLKSNERYFYKHILTNRWGCTQQLVDFLTDLIIKDKNVVEELKEEQKQKNSESARGDIGLHLFAAFRPPGDFFPNYVTGRYVIDSVFLFEPRRLRSLAASRGPE